MHVQNAQNHRAGRPQRGDARCVPFRDPVAISADAAMPWQTLDRDIRLDADGYTIER